MAQGDPAGHNARRCLIPAATSCAPRAASGRPGPLLHRMRCALSWVPDSGSRRALPSGSRGRPAGLAVEQPGGAIRAGTRGPGGGRGRRRWSRRAAALITWPRPSRPTRRGRKRLMSRPPVDAPTAAPPEATCPEQTRARAKAAAAAAAAPSGRGAEAASEPPPSIRPGSHPRLEPAPPTAVEPPPAAPHRPAPPPRHLRRTASRRR